MEQDRDAGFPPPDDSGGFPPTGGSGGSSPFTTTSTGKGTDDAHRRFADALDRYGRSLQRAAFPPEFQQRADEAFRRFAQDMSETFAPEQVRRRLESADREYLAEVEAAWSEVSASGLDLTTLGAIGDTLRAAATLAASTGPRDTLGTPPGFTAWAQGGFAAPSPQAGAWPAPGPWPQGGWPGFPPPCPGGWGWGG